ncbi:T9SS type A sorting domain-containing protein [Bacteroidota bacterium]
MKTYFVKTTGMILLFVIAAFVHMQLFNNADSEYDNLTTKEIKKKLNKQISKLDLNSEEAIKLGNLYQRIHKKENARYLKQENPGKFLEALKEIKTAYDGTTYKPNYRSKELAKAVSRRKSNPRLTNDILPWLERGPGNVAGRTQQLIVDAADPSGNTWFAATVGGGVWKTEDGGTSWVNKTPELTTLSTTTITQCTSNPDVIYIGTGMGFGRVVDLAGSGVWKSTDHGETWTQLQSTANNELLAAINRIIVDPNNENLVLVCSNDDYTSFGPNGGERISGIFRSTDGGSSWNQVFDPDIMFGTETDNRVQHIIANPDNFNMLYASVNEMGVVKSDDAGLTWMPSLTDVALAADIGTGEGSYQGISTRIELAIAPSDPNRIYAAVERWRGIADLYMSKDGGESWGAIPVPDTGSDPNWFSSTGQSGAVTYTAGWFNNTIVVSPYNKNVLFVGGVEIYKINIDDVNNIRTTVEVGSTNEVHADHHDLDIIPINEATDSYLIVNSNDGGIGVSSDRGYNWTQLSGLGSTQFYGADKKPDEDAYFGGTQDNGTWLSGINPNSNSNWTFEIGGDGFETAWNYSDPDILLGGSQNGNLSRSVDGGNSWIAIPDAKPGTGPFITKIASSDVDPDLVFTVGSAGIKRSDDFGASWTLTTVPGNWIGNRAFANAEISLANPQVVWITSPLDIKPWLGVSGGIYVSNDAGLSFTNISQNFPPTVTESSGIATHPTDPNTAYMMFSAAGTPKILETNDLGQTWIDITGFSGIAGALNKSAGFNESTNGFPDVATFSLIVMPYDTDIIWVGTEIGLFISEDGGTSWNIADNGIPRVGIFQMFIQDGQVVVSTYGRGIWTVELPELTNYELPSPTLSPRLNQVVQAPTGDVVISIDLRSSYDETEVYLNGVVYQVIPANAESSSEEILYTVTEEETITFNVISYKDGREYKTPAQTLTVAPVTPQDSYESAFVTDGSSDHEFSGNGFSIRNYTGFAYAAIHSNHPYGQQNEYTYRLNIPIIVADENAIFEYDDVALIEEGIVNDYTNTNFFDYVIVEASTDGAEWIPLLNGYDSRYDPAWSQAYNSGLAGYDSSTPGDESMYRTHTINLHDFFNPGDVILIRFRLSSDALAVAWGWAIDNIKIQTNATDVDDDLNDLPKSYSLEQNYPNPFNPSTTIEYSIPALATESETSVKLMIYDILGKQVEVLVNETKRPGVYQVEFNASKFSSGVYFYTLQAGDFIQSKKMILLK